MSPDEKGSLYGNIVSSLLVACHEHGTTLSGFLPASWDHLVASYGTTRRVVRVGSSARLLASVTCPSPPRLWRCCGRSRPAKRSSGSRHHLGLGWDGPRLHHGERDGSRPQ